MTSIPEPNGYYIAEIIKKFVFQGFIIVRDDESITSRIKDLAPKFLWEVESHLLEDKEKKKESVLICRKKFWAIVWNRGTMRAWPLDKFSLLAVRFLKIKFVSPLVSYAFCCYRMKWAKCHYNILCKCVETFSSIFFLIIFYLNNVCSPIWRIQVLTTLQVYMCFIFFFLPSLGIGGFLFQWLYKLLIKFPIAFVSFSCQWEPHWFWLLVSDNFLLTIFVWKTNRFCTSAFTSSLFLKFLFIFFILTLSLIF